VRGDSIKDVVLTGSLTATPYAKRILYPIADNYGLRFTIPDKAVFATAIGTVAQN
jgi:hypothetical protein